MEQLPEDMSAMLAAAVQCGGSPLAEVLRREGNVSKGRNPVTIDAAEVQGLEELTDLTAQCVSSLDDALAQEVVSAIMRSGTSSQRSSMY